MNTFSLELETSRGSSKSALRTCQDKTAMYKVKMWCNVFKSAIAVYYEADFVCGWRMHEGNCVPAICENV